MISKKRKLELLISIKHFFIKEQRYVIACLIRDEEREIGIDNSVKYIEAGHQEGPQFNLIVPQRLNIFVQ